MSGIKRMGKRLTKGLFALLFLVSLAGLLAPFIPLEWLPAVQVIPPLMLVLGILNLIFVILFVRQKSLGGALLALLAVAGTAWALSKDVQSFSAKDDSSTEGLKVISYNVGGFGFEARCPHILPLRRHLEGDPVHHPRG